ncbi:glutamate-ammonia-ligase adenylyltransferase [Propionibacterium cyclohexanicum]|uniref:Glutamate-ammonia-ligase adenylyltransferase n=1 Tax=Propionibacterium cyclohexanicum TaxID=64702 RepID=A0A1H9PH17_9ACTN|nr:bifunctional [glutamine synthetase] adenylyltransferase/[glutamine synthetase]-adenylyl-L-tyrosine phosphorylase [Propionibacterium cyclohexanicum]SER47512.1 glutamate-ammonia-ligase adenylyltransferase [Propionibacterium cyclohexanicum]
MRARGRTTSTTAELARKGFTDVTRAAGLVDSLDLRTPGLVDELAGAADPDQALVTLADLSAGAAALISQLSDDAGWRARVIAVAGFSRALARHLTAHPIHLQVLRPEPARWSARRILDDLLGAVGLGSLAGAPPEQLAMASAGDEGAADRLRLANKRHLVRIAGRDLSCPDPSTVVDDIAAELADLADAVMICALAIARAQVSGSGAARLGIVALGKCGAQELNYLSDIDVLFVAEPADPGADDGAAMAVANKLAAATMRICSAHSACGTIWQVDAALRPEGNAGPLTRSLAGHRAYYTRWARNWEFQAMLKARPMAGDLDLARGFIDIVRPLIWQVGGRENFMAELQSMRRRVVELIPAADAEYEIKLGSGGLRDVEFSVQLLQLVHGRVDDRLRHRGTLVSLHALADHGYIGRADAAALDAAYRLERTLEHRVQLQHLRRSHLFPPPGDDREHIARSLGAADGDALWATWRRTALEVERRQRRVFYSPLLLTVSTLSDDELRLSPQAAQDRLKALGFLDASGALHHIEALTSGSTRAVEIQRQLLPAMLGWFAEGPNPDLGLISFRRLSEAMGSTSWYLRALRDEGQMAELLAQTLSTSRYIIAMLNRDPSAVQLLQDESELTPRSRESLMASMTAVVRRHEGAQDAVSAVRALRRRELMRLAFGDVLGRIDVDAVGQGLTALADATIQAALVVAVRDHPEPVPPIGVVAMGSWGGAELNYASDIDAMFVVPDGTRPEQSAQALAVVSTVRALLRSPGPEPPLEVDAGLRPEGRDGPLVRTVSSCLAYYRRWSQTWEHQALLRADVGAGDEDLVRELLAGISELRWPPQGISAVQESEIRRLKARMEAERIARGSDPHRNLKLGPGGLSDVQWTVQLLQLRHAGRLPALRSPSTLSALNACEAEGLLDAEDAAALRDAWHAASRMRNATMLVRARSSDQLPSDSRELAAVAMLMGHGKAEASQLLESYGRITRHASAVVERVFWGASS